jgi:hypothetical protein
MYYPIHHYVGQAAPSSSAAQPSDPLAGVQPDEAFTGGVILASRATLGMFLGGIVLYSLAPSLGLGIPRWAITLLGGVGGLMLGTYAGIQGAIGAMPSLQPQQFHGVQDIQDLLNKTPNASGTPSMPAPPSSSSPSTVAT